MTSRRGEKGLLEPNKKPQGLRKEMERLIGRRRNGLKMKKTPEDSLDRERAKGGVISAENPRRATRKG